MAAAFAQTLRALAADRPRASIAGVALAAAVLLAWMGWASRAKVALYAVTDKARIEVEQRAYAIDAPLAGRIARMDLVLGAQVNAGDTLMELDAELERRQLDQLRVRLAAIGPQAEAAQRELKAQERALGDDERATLAALDEGKARLEESRLAAGQASDEAERAARLANAGAIPPLEATRLASQAGQRAAASQAAALALAKLQREQATRGSQGLARVESLRRDLAALDGQKATMLADVRVLEQTIARSIVRSPVSGHVGEIAPINAGAYVHPGDRVASIVPPGELKAVADFVPADALGRVRAGQSARLRLVGFPWMQYGAVEATVTRVASEVRDGRVRVELAIHPAAGSAIPMQHGLPAVAEVDVERVSPARLVLRTIGAVLVQPTEGGAGS